MSKMSIQERRRIKQRQLLIRKMTKIGIISAFVILLGVFLIRGVILPLMGRSGGSKAKPEEVAYGEINEDGSITYEMEKGDMAERIPVFSDNDTAKAADLTPGWHDNSLADGTEIRTELSMQTVFRRSTVRSTRLTAMAMCRQAGSPEA